MTPPDDEIEIDVTVDNTTRDTVSPHTETASPTDEGDALADELGRVSIRTTPEGYVEGEVTALESVDERTVRLEVRLPHGRTVSASLEKPIPWAEEFLLARIVEDVGYDAASVDHLVGESIYLTRTDMGPTAEDGDPDDWSRLIRSASNTVLASVGSSTRLEAENAPEWRLVDPLERPTADATTGTLIPAPYRPLVAVAGVAVGVVLAVAGAVVSLTGGFTGLATALLFGLPGILIAVFAAWVFARK